MTAPQLKANFAVENKYGAFYTGGVVQDKEGRKFIKIKLRMSKDGDHLLCQCGHTVQCLDVQSGKPSTPIGSEDSDDEVTCFTLSPDDEILVVASRNLQLKQWNWKERIATRTWKAIHTGPISSMAFDVTSTLLATGGADASIKVWDVIKQYCTHNLHGHSGVISVVAFHPDSERLQLFSAGDDYAIRVWSLQTSSCVAALEGHYSVVTSIKFSPGGETVYSAGRDNVVIMWDGLKLAKLRTIPVYETIEALVLLPEGRKFPAQNVVSDSPHFVTGGSKGLLRVWNAETSCCVFPAKLPDNGSTEAEPEVGSADAAITAVQLHAGLDALTVVTYDHNIAIHDLENFAPKKHFVGYNDDVLDMQLVGSDDSHLVVATNSPLLKVFEVTTWSCQVLKGHTDIVLCVAVKKGANLFATGSKDNSVRLWQMDAETQVVQCVAIGSGHTHAVNSVSFSRVSGNFLVTGSHDCTLKVWPVPELVPGELLGLTASLTEHAHEKEINSVVVTPNDKMLASGSQDKTAKLWSARTLALLGVFRGHKRSIWCIQFSPVDQVLATASADGTLKIWSLTDFSCVKTFEGHQSSVLCVHFVTRGMQLLSSGSDGLLKLWTIKSNECVGTWDEHDEKVWALAVSADERTVVTGAGDSTICMWKDITEEEQAETLRKQEEFILQEQQLANLVHDKKYVKAVGLAITLNQPFRVLGIFKELLDEDEGRQDAERTLHTLREDQIDSVLGYAAKWNTNSKHCHVAQFVVRLALQRFSPEQLLKLANVKVTIEALLPYTERHFQRMNRLQQQTTFVDYTWQSMKMVSVSPSVAVAVEELETSTYGSLGVGSWIESRIGQVMKTGGASQKEAVPQKETEREENQEEEEEEEEGNKVVEVSVRRKEEEEESESSDISSDDTSEDSVAMVVEVMKINGKKTRQVSLVTKQNVIAQQRKAAKLSQRVGAVEEVLPGKGSSKKGSPKNGSPKKGSQKKGLQKNGSPKKGSLKNDLAKKNSAWKDSAKKDSAKTNSAMKGGTSPKLTPRKSKVEISDKENTITSFDKGKKKTSTKGRVNTPCGTPGKKKQEQVISTDVSLVNKRKATATATTPQSTKRRKTTPPSSAKRRK